MDLLTLHLEALISTLPANFIGFGLMVQNLLPLVSERANRRAVRLVRARRGR